VLIHGSGAVRAGIWARSLLINASLNEGSQLPYIERALRSGYGVLVLNTNDNTRNGRSIPGSNTPRQHGECVWREYVSPFLVHSGGGGGTRAAAKRSGAIERVAIVAHSAGGLVTTHMANSFSDDFLKHVVAIAFTDAVFNTRDLSNKLETHFSKVARNWASSTAPIDTHLNPKRGSVLNVSAGHPQHEMASEASRESVFDFIAPKLASLTLT
jgi:pimeloyl-ACP methyl ester carboxylesterase